MWTPRLRFNCLSCSPPQDRKPGEREEREREACSALYLGQAKGACAL